MSSTSKASLRAQKRLSKELQSIIKEPIPGVRINADEIESNLFEWVVEMDGAPHTLYEDEKFMLKFKFSQEYPFDSPQVVFVGPNIPVHPHIYSNGHICLSILSDDWSPALSLSSICLSIVSMLSSCKEKRLPPDNASYVRGAGSNPKKTKWAYHDDSV